MALVFIVAFCLRFRFLSMTSEGVQGMEISAEFIGDYMERWEWCIAYLCLSLAGVCAIVIVPIKAIIQGLIEAKRGKRPNNSMASISEEPHQECTKNTLAYTNDKINTSTPDETQVMSSVERMEAIKPLIINEFWTHSFWGLDADYSVFFRHELTRLLEEKGGIMRLGHLAWLLWRYGWTAESQWDFSAFIRDFFSKLGFKCPGETSPKKYSSDNRKFDSTFKEVDSNFGFLLHPERYPNLSKIHRPPHHKK